MKLLFVLNPCLDDYNISGAALQAINLGNSLSSIGFQVDYIANECIRNMIDNKLSNLYTIDNINKRGAIRKTLEYAVEIYNSGSYDIMHINIHQMSVLDAIVDIVPDYVNIVYTQHTSTILGRFSFGYRESARILSKSRTRKKCKIVMPSKYMIKVWEKYTGLSSSEMDNVVCIYNGTNDHMKNLSYERENFYVTCGRIDPNKRIVELTEFCSRYKIPLIVIGSLGFGTLKVSESAMEYYNKFLEMVDNKYIKYIKYLSNDKVIDLISRARGYITFSKQESFGLTVAESMSVGTPVFYIENESAISELYDDNETAMIIGDMKRKSKNNKQEMIYTAFKKIGFLDNPSIDKIDSIRERYEKLNLSRESSAKNYKILFEELINSDL